MNNVFTRTVLCGAMVAALATYAPAAGPQKRPAKPVAPAVRETLAAQITAEAQEQAVRGANLAQAEANAQVQRALADALAGDQMARATAELDAIGARLDALKASTLAGVDSSLSLIAARIDQDVEGRIRGQLQQRLSASREESLYDRGTNEIDAGRWERAAATFEEVANAKGHKAEGALYWRAYSLNKLGQRDAALATLQALSTSYPNSRWQNDAKALQMEIRQNSGQGVAPGGAGDDELKLLALNALIQGGNTDQALPALEKILKSSQSPKLKDRALFVLAQSNSPKARALLLETAKSGSNPDLQLKAIKYLGLHGKDSSQDLMSIYQSSSDADVKRAVLRGLMLSGDKDRVLTLAKSEQNAELRQDAIRQLGIMGGQAELWQLYGTEPTVEGKERILSSMFIAGNADKLLEVARTEKDPRLRRAAVRDLGLIGSRNRSFTAFVARYPAQSAFGSSGAGAGVGAGTGTGTASGGRASAVQTVDTGAMLVSLYPNEQDQDVKKEIIRALFIQQNAKALVDLARKETNPELKKELFRDLSVMKSKEATDYMMEVLNK